MSNLPDNSSITPKGGKRPSRRTFLVVCGGALAVVALLAGLQNCSPSDDQTSSSIVVNSTTLMNDPVTECAYGAILKSDHTFDHCMSQEEYDQSVRTDRESERQAIIDTNAALRAAIDDLNAQVTGALDNRARLGVILTHFCNSRPGLKFNYAREVPEPGQVFEYGSITKRNTSLPRYDIENLGDYGDEAARLWGLYWNAADVNFSLSQDFGRAAGEMC